MGFRHGGSSRTGTERQVNQDSWCAEDELGLYVVADGAGGLENGNVASRLTVYEIRRAFRQAKPRKTADRRAAIMAGVESANEEILNWIRSGGGKRMASTVVVASCDGPDALIANVGDSRCYRLRQGTLERLTRDHTIAAELARARGLDDKEARRLPYQHVLSRAVGSRDGCEVELNSATLEPGDVLLLCTDGLSGAIPDAELQVLVARLAQDLESAAGELVAEARTRGGDDVTALLFRYGSESERNWSRVRFRSRD